MPLRQQKYKKHLLHLGEAIGRGATGRRQAPTGLLVFLAQLDKLDKLEKTAELQDGDKRLLTTNTNEDC